MYTYRYIWKYVFGNEALKMAEAAETDQLNSGSSNFSTFEKLTEEIVIRKWFIKFNGAFIYVYILYISSSSSSSSP